MNILFIGLGNMGLSVAKSLQSDSHQLFAIDPYLISRANSQDFSNIQIYEDLDSASANISVDIEVIILAVKPQVVFSVLSSLQAYLSKDTLLLSLVAGLEIASIQESFTQGNVEHETYAIARIMPNIAAKIQESITALSIPSHLSERHKTFARDISASIGKVIEIPESLMSAVTGLAGSGIAFVAKFIDAMTMAGVRSGMSYEQSYQTVLQVFRGTLGLLSSDTDAHTHAQFASPSDFIHAVCSPGGTTIEGIFALEECGFDSTIFHAVEAAKNKSDSFATQLKPSSNQK